MKYDIHLFNFYGTPVSIRPLFFLLFLITTPTFAVSLFIAALIHELAHTRVAQKLGHQVESIYIDLLNGAANIDITKATPLESIKIVIAGPLSNLLLFGIVFALSHIGIDYPSIIAQFLKEFQFINIFLFIFNLIPIFPMDGGRILRDLVMLKTKNKRLSIEGGSFVSIVLSLILGGISLLNSYWIMLAMMIFAAIINVIIWYGEVNDIK